MNEFEKLEQLYSLRLEALKSGHMTLATIVFGAILYELHHTDTPFKIVIATKDPEGKFPLTDNHDIIHIEWENHSVWERLSYLSNHVISSLMKRPMEFVPMTYHHISQQNTDYKKEEEIYRKLDKLTSVVDCIQILRGNHNVFDAVRKMVKGFRLRDKHKVLNES